MANESSGNGRFVLGVLFGALVGAVAGVMFAPKSGLEIRSDLADRGEVWRKIAEELGYALLEHARPGKQTDGEGVNGHVRDVHNSGNQGV